MSYQQRSTFFWVIFIVLILIIVIGIFPQYGFLYKQISDAKARNYAANISSSTAANYILRKKNHRLGTPITNCKDVTNIVGVTLPKGAYIKNIEIPHDKVVFCTLNVAGVGDIEFSVIGIS